MLLNYFYGVGSHWIAENKEGLGVSIIRETLYLSTMLVAHHHVTVANHPYLRVFVQLAGLIHKELAQSWT